MVSCFVVTNTADSGFGSLRFAIDCANTTPGPDTITFDIDGTGPHTIAPQSPLPQIREAVRIDGSSEPDYAGTPVVELDGSDAGIGADGLVILAGPSMVRGLAINRFDDAGIQLGRSDGHTIEDDFIGTDVFGTTGLGNGTGIRLSKSSNNMIGTAAAGNLISGNVNAGVRIAGKTSTGNLIQNNLIGTDSSGSTAIANAFGVAIVGGQNNTVGGAVAGQGNIIAGNTTCGVFLQGDNNRVAGNRIGVDSSGDAAIANSDGIQVAASTGNVIGGTAAGASNQISGNLQHGILLSGARATGNFVQGNLIGTDAAGTGTLGNAYGVVLFDAPNNVIGGTDTGAGNTISGNTRHGVLLKGAGATNNRVEGNEIGTSPSGDGAVGNQHGVVIYGAPGNIVGGTAAGAGNVISGNSGHGVRLMHAGATGNLVQSNWIGINATGTTAIPNREGIFFATAARDNTVGGADPSAANEIAHNNGRGVFVTLKAGTGNAVTQNSIHNNSGLGIDLAGKGRTANDPDDADTGANNLQNCPEITSAILDNGDLDIEYSIPSSTTDSAYPITVEFYFADGDGEEGESYLGSHTYGAPGVITAQDIPGGGAAGGTILVAAATDADGNTSEFSTPVVVSEPLTAAGEPPAARSAGGPPADVRVITSGDLSPIVGAATDRLVAAGFGTDLFTNVQFAIADLPGATLGMATGNTITIDANAAGHGWAVSRGTRVESQEPEDSDAYSGSRLSTLDSRLHMDLLTVVMHELGHVAGLEDLDDPAAEDDLMYRWLEAGVRKTSLEASLADEVFSQL